MSGTSGSGYERRLPLHQLLYTAGGMMKIDQFLCAIVLYAKRIDAIRGLLPPPSSNKVWLEDITRILLLCSRTRRITILPSSLAQMKTQRTSILQCILGWLRILSPHSTPCYPFIWCLERLYAVVWISNVQRRLQRSTFTAMACCVAICLLICIWI